MGDKIDFFKNRPNLVGDVTFENGIAHLLTFSLLLALAILVFLKRS